MSINTEERLARLEGIIEEIRRELSHLHAQANSDRAINIGLWVTTMLVIFGSALFLK